MNKNVKILVICIVSFLIISGIFAQTTLASSTAPNAKESPKNTEGDLSTTPKTSSVSDNYNWGDGNSMDIDSVDTTGTNTTLHNETGSDYRVSSDKKSDYTTTTLNETYQIKNGGSTTLLYDGATHVASIDTPPEDHYTFLQDIQGFSDFYLRANKANPNDDFLDSFYLKIDKTYEIRFDYYDNPYGFDLSLYAPIFGDYYKIGLDYNETENTFKWCRLDYAYRPIDTSVYLINETGAYRNETGVYVKKIGWNDPVNWWYDNLNKVNITSSDCTIIFNKTESGKYMYSMIFTKGIYGNITMRFIEQYDGNYFFDWCNDVIKVYCDSGEEIINIIFFLRGYSDLLYTISWDIHELEINMFWWWVTIEWHWISIEVWWIELTYLHFIIIFHWVWWSFKIQIWYDLDQSKFKDYIVWLQYKITWIYIYYVPTNILPNMLKIDIVKEVFDEDYFYITIEIKNWTDELVDYDTISITWDGIPVISIRKISEGTYKITLMAILVSDTTGRNLNIIATKLGYADGQLNVEIAVDPEAVDKEDDDDDDDEDANEVEHESLNILTLILIVIGVVFAIAAIAVITIFAKKKGFLKRGSIKR